MRRNRNSRSSRVGRHLSGRDRRRRHRSSGSEPRRQHARRHAGAAHRDQHVALRPAFVPSPPRARTAAACRARRRRVDRELDDLGAGRAHRRYARSARSDGALAEAMRATARRRGRRRVESGPARTPPRPRRRRTRRRSSSASRGAARRSSSLPSKLPAFPRGAAGHDDRTPPALERRRGIGPIDAVEPQLDQVGAAPRHRARGGAPPSSGPVTVTHRLWRFIACRPKTKKASSAEAEEASWNPVILRVQASGSPPQRTHTTTNRTTGPSEARLSDAG